jgi:hypothetical protein
MWRVITFAISSPNNRSLLMAAVDPENVLGRTRAENACFVIEQMRALVGFDPHLASRLMQMYRALSRGYVPFGDPNFPAALEAERDMQQLGFIFSRVNPCRDHPVFRALLDRLLSDSVLPQDDRKESEGRDAQFELYIAALCQNAGLSPVAYEEPDVTCMVDGIKFGVAAKRIKSLSQLEKHVRKGAKQIQRSGLPGVVALELSLALNPNNLPVVSQTQSAWFETIEQLAAHQFFAERQNRIHDWVDGKGVRAVVVFDFKIRVRPGPEWGLDGMINWLSTARADGQAVREFDTFYGGFLRGVPNLKDLSDDE